jgi:glucose/arabinose dehydrogenase
MTKKTKLVVSVAAAMLGLTRLAFGQADELGGGERGPGVPEFWVRAGLRVTLAAEGFGEARFMEFDPNGTLYVSQPNSGSLIALRPAGDEGGKFGGKVVLVSGMKKLHGLCMADDGYLYFTTTGAIYRFKPAKEPAPLGKQDIQTVIPEGQIPQGGGHWWRSIVVKGGKLWTSIGDSGNLSDETNTERQKIWQFTINPETGAAADKTLWSTGIRNTEKLRFRPGTDSLYGCDHGSDTFGNRYGENNGGRNGGPITDNWPPCEFNHYIKGFNYGHPFVTGLGLPRPEFANRPDILELVDINTAPEWCFGGHWAPNGWNFTTGTKTLDKAGDAVVALHGSWNARQKQGYRIERICFDEATGKPYGAMMLVGTLKPGTQNILARPVDVVEEPGGAILWSDDSGGKIYRISRVK